MLSKGSKFNCSGVGCCLSGLYGVQEELGCGERGFGGIVKDKSRAVPDRRAAL